MDYQSSKNKKKIGSIPWAHSIRLSAHAICITLGTADITSSHRDFHFLICTILNPFEDVLWRQSLDLGQPFPQCSQATRPSHLHAKLYPQEEHKIPTPHKIFFLTFSCQNSCTLGNIHWTSHQLVLHSLWNTQAFNHQHTFWHEASSLQIHS